MGVVGGDLGGGGERVRVGGVVLGGEVGKGGGGVGGGEEVIDIGWM